MANPVLLSPYAAFGHLPSNGDDRVVADERRAAHRRYATFLILLRRWVPTARPTSSFLGSCLYVPIGC
jgi:hypothetical protein